MLELRYGLDGQQPRTLDEVGRTFNVTRERIRQIEHQSLKKLRALAEAQQRPRRRVGRSYAPRCDMSLPPVRRSESALRASADPDRHRSCRADGLRAG